MLSQKSIYYLHVFKLKITHLLTTLYLSSTIAQTSIAHGSIKIATCNSDRRSSINCMFKITSVYQALFVDKKKKLNDACEQ